MQSSRCFCRVIMRTSLCIFACVLTVAGVEAVSLAERSDGNGVLDKIKAGLQYATSYLETAKDIADLVAKSLAGERFKHEDRDDVRGNENEKAPFGTPNIVSAFFRLMGLDSQKVTAIAVNSVIFLAQMISSLFGLKLPKENIGRSLEDEDYDSSWSPDRLITDSGNERIKKLIDQARDENLSNELIEKVDGTDSACIRLLLCKTSPVIRAAQHFLKNRTRGKSHPMTSWMPSRDEFEENSDECENAHTDCSLFS